MLLKCLLSVFNKLKIVLYLENISFLKTSVWSSKVFISSLLSLQFQSIYLLKIGNVGSESHQRSIVGKVPIFDTNEQGFVRLAKIHDNILHVVIVSLKDSLISDTSQVLVQWIQFSCSNFDVPEHLKMETSYSFLGKGLPNLCWLENDYTKLFILCDKEFATLGMSISLHFVLFSWWWPRCFSYWIGL